MNEFKAQCILCKRTLSLGTLGVKVLVSHTKSEKRQLTSKIVKSHYHILLYAFATSYQSKFIQFCSTQTLRHLCHITVKRHSNHLWHALDFEHLFGVMLA